MVYCGGSLFAEAPSAGLYKRELLPPLNDKNVLKTDAFFCYFHKPGKKTRSQAIFKLSCEQ